VKDKVYKTYSYNLVMVKNKKNKELDFLSIFKSTYDFKILERKTSKKNLILYSALWLFLISFLNMVFYNQNIFEGSMAYIINFLSSLVGTPLILFMVFLLFITILNAFENKTHDFFYSYLIFLVSNLPFIFLLHIVNKISIIIFNSVILLILSIITTIIFIYYLISFINNFKNYYKTSISRIISSLLVIFIIVISIITIAYLNLLINSLNTPVF
jgi:membrane-associated HD superfamily phosphohydrolase